MESAVKMDEEARAVCKAHGCRVMKCLSKKGMEECGPLMATLNTCLSNAKRELAPKYGLPIE